MKVMRRALLVAALLLAAASGCKCTPTPQPEVHYAPPATNQLQATDFNKEVYVWEGFIFSTNRVEGGK